MEPKQIEELLTDLKNKESKVTPDELVKQIRDTRFFVPVNFKNEEAMKAMGEQLAKGEKVQVPADANPVPVLIETREEKDKKRFLGVYTDQAQIPNTIKSNGIIQMPFDGIMGYAKDEKHKVDGVVINPFTQNFVMQLNRNPKTMTPGQFHQMVRRNVEFALLPSGLYKENGKEFFDKISEDFLYKAYTEQYKNSKLSFPVARDDVQMLDLGISATLDLKSINLPVKGAPEGAATRILVTWDSEKNRGGYYLITKAGKNNPAKFLFLAPSRKTEEVGDVPSEGSEMSAVLEFEEKRED